MKMIYTSYFGSLKRLPADFVPVAICGKMVFPWHGLRYPKLAPKKCFFDVWKKTHDNGYYVSHYEHQVLAALDRNEVIRELRELVGDDSKTICLVCYETPDKFCHRHLVAKWLGCAMEWCAEDTTI